MTGGSSLQQHSVELCFPSKLNAGEGGGGERREGGGEGVGRVEGLVRVRIDRRR